LRVTFCGGEVKANQGPLVRGRTVALLELGLGKGKIKQGLSGTYLEKTKEKGGKKGKKVRSSLNLTKEGTKKK